MTKAAALDVLDALAREAPPAPAAAGGGGDARYRWFKGFLGDRLAVFDGPAPPGAVWGPFLLELLGAPLRHVPSPAPPDAGGVGGGGMVDPEELGRRVLRRRAELAAGPWAAAAAAAAADHAAVLRRHLDARAAAPAPPAAEGGGGTLRVSFTGPARPGPSLPMTHDL